MMPKIIKLKDELRGLYDGAAKLAKIVSTTLGPKGNTVILQKAFGPAIITKDGVSVAKEIELKDKLEDVGAQLLKEVANKTVDKVGDGTTTAIVLANEMLAKGAQAVASGMNTMDVKRGMDLAANKVIEELKAMAQKVDNDFEKIAQVGTISANGDEQIGKYIAEAMQKVGPDGVVTVEENTSIFTEIKHLEGMQFDRGYLSPHFVSTKSEKMVCEMDNPYVLLCDKKISTVQQIVPILEFVMQKGKPLLIVAEDIESEALATLIINKLRGTLKVCAVKAPGFGDRRKAILEDLAVLTNGVVISEEVGIDIMKAGENELGQVKRVTVSKDETVMIGGYGNIDAINERCKEIIIQIEDANSEYDKEKLKERLSKLRGGVVVISVGGRTDTEVKKIKDDVDDALHATKAAVEGGIVAGGGSALLHCLPALENLSPKNNDQKFGIDIIRSAIKAPARMIFDNAGLDSSVIISDIVKSGDKFYGYDVNSNSFCDMIKAGVADPAMVPTLALSHAVSIAALIISSGGCVLNDPDEKDDAKDMGRMSPDMM